MTYDEFAELKDTAFVTKSDADDIFLEKLEIAAVGFFERSPSDSPWDNPMQLCDAMKMGIKANMNVKGVWTAVYNKDDKHRAVSFGDPANLTDHKCFDGGFSTFELLPSDGGKKQLECCDPEMLEWK